MPKSKTSPKKRKPKKIRKEPSGYDLQWMAWGGNL